MTDTGKIFVIHPFKNLACREAVKTHLRKAAPENAHRLISAIVRLLNVGPHGSPFVRRLFDINSKGGKLSFAAVHVDDLVAIIEMIPQQRRLLILAVLDLCRLEVRSNGKLCDIVEEYFDVNGEPHSLTIAVDPGNRLVCSRVWVTGELKRVVLDLIIPRPPAKVAG